MKVDKIQFKIFREAKVNKTNVYGLSQDSSVFSNPVEELSSEQSGNVANLPNSPPTSRESLGNTCSRTIGTTRSILRILTNTFLFRLAKIIVMTFALFQESLIFNSLYSNELATRTCLYIRTKFQKITSSPQIGLSHYVQLND